MATIRIETDHINDWASFHLKFKEAFGFFDGYGNNMNAWIDCMSYLTDDESLVALTLSGTETITFEITETEKFRKRLPEIFEALVDCTAFVNNRYIDSEEGARISLMFL